MNDADLDYASPAPPGPFPGSALASVTSWLRLVIPAFAGLTADLWTKNFVQQHLEGHEDVVLWPKVLIFTYTENPGAVFGMGKGHVTLFILFSILALGVIAFFFIGSDRKQRTLHVALGLITAGALGNLYDRMLYGQVRDFILLLPRFWPFIFNVADVLLCVGVPLLMLCFILRRSPQRRPTPG